MFERVGPRFREITETTFYDTCKVVRLDESINNNGECVHEDVIIWEDLPCAISWGNGTIDKDGLTYKESQVGVLMYPKEIHLESGCYVMSRKNEGQWCVIGGTEKNYITHREQVICRITRVL
ncbi:hypothetical protein [Chakrabartyella piscis]|uniref:hypothetical protein n=1 Tax=Chakrabartyella piscis TaxID=2918914 RepID=UPI002958D4EB|nr:hypothetical protein [Chakrabartyella piscis]